MPEAPLCICQPPDRTPPAAPASAMPPAAANISPPMRSEPIPTTQERIFSSQEPLPTLLLTANTRFLTASVSKRYVLQHKIVSFCHNYRLKMKYFFLSKRNTLYLQYKTIAK